MQQLALPQAAFVTCHRVLFHTYTHKYNTKSTKWTQKNSFCSLFLNEIQCRINRYLKVNALYITKNSEDIICAHSVEFHLPGHL